MKTKTCLVCNTTEKLPNGDCKLCHYFVDKYIHNGTRKETLEEGFLYYIGRECKTCGCKIRSTSNGCMNCHLNGKYKTKKYRSDQRAYRNNRYKNDPDFREYHLNYAKNHRTEIKKNRDSSNNGKSNI